MHLPDGILPASVCAAGYAAAAGATWYSLRKIKQREDPREGIPKASLFAGVFFVASLVHIPLPPVSVHLILNGLLGVALGWYAMPAILIGLFFQAVMFGHGGLTTLGVNAAIMGIPALLAFGIFRLRGFAGLGNKFWTGAFGFLGGFLGLVIAAIVLFFVLVTTIPANLDAGVERAAITALVIAHLPLAAIEGAFTAMVVLFLMKVDPRLLETKAGEQKLARDS
ncbi:MAG: cobalt transporter CbiM [Rubrobacteraceae bacterium]